METLTVEVPADLLADIDRLAAAVKIRRDTLVCLALRSAVDRFGQMAEDSAVNPAGFDGDT